jgi:spermidine/putrescine transport system permease protein
VTPARLPRPRGARLGGAWLLVPNWLWTALFFAIPLLFILVFSVGRRGTYGGIVFDVSFDNYAKLLDPLYVAIYLQSFAMAAVATAGCLLIGYPVAYVLAFKAGRWRNLLLVLLIVPFWTSMLIRAYAWMIILNDNGLLNRVLQALGLGGVSILYRPPAIVLGMVYTYLPLMVLPLFVALDRIDPRLLEAARDLGATRRRTFQRVTLRLSVPGLVAGTLLVGIPATGEFLVPALLGGGRQLMIGNLVAQEFIANQNWPLGSAISVVLMVLLMAAVALYLRFPGARETQELRPA